MFSFFFLSELKDAKGINLLQFGRREYLQLLFVYWPCIKWPWQIHFFILIVYTLFWISYVFHY